MRTDCKENIYESANEFWANATAEIARSGGGEDASPSLFQAHRVGVYRLDQAVHIVSQQTPSARYGGSREWFPIFPLFFPLPTCTFGELAIRIVGMDEFHPQDDVSLCEKIASLVRERGWNIDEFARQADLNRLTIRGIILGPVRRLHHATVAACARALGVSVHDLQTQPLDRLLPRMRLALPDNESLRVLYERATQPELLAWLEANRSRAEKLTTDEIDELLSLQGTGGPLTALGVEHHVAQLDRRRLLIEKAMAVANTEYVDLLEQFVGLLYEKIQPYRDRGK